MNAATKKQTPVDQLDNGDWLLRLLKDVQREVARQPSPQAVARIRARMVAGIESPTRAAA